MNEFKEKVGLIWLSFYLPDTAFFFSSLTEHKKKWIPHKKARKKKPNINQSGFRAEQRGQDREKNEITTL